jgi:hypothetical protein
MSRIGRSVRLASGCIITALVLLACGANPPTPVAPTPSPPAFRHFDGEDLSFDYPGSWNAGVFPVVSSFSSAIVYLSTAPLADPCDRTANSVACVRNAVSGLGPDGVLVEWSHRAFPGWAFDPTKGRPLRVGDRRATLERIDGSSPRCQGIGSERELVVTIDDPTPDQNWTEAHACLRGPSLDGLQAQVEAMLATVTWKR